MSNPIMQHIGYPLTALVTFNMRIALYTRKIIFPMLIFLVPPSIAVFWRVVYALFPPEPGIMLADPYFFYTELSRNLCIFFIVPLIALLMGSSILSGEVEDGTIIFLRLRSTPRTVIVAGKFLGYWVSSTILLAISLFITFCILASVPDSGMLQFDLGTLWQDIWIFSLGLAAYGAVMMFVGIALKNSFIAGIFLLFMWDPFVTYAPGMTYRISIRHYIQSLLPASEEGSLLALLESHPPSSIFTSLSTLLLITLGAVSITALLLKHREWTGKRQEN